MDKITQFKQTEVGLIPKDWEVEKIEELFDIFAGGDLAKIKFSKNKNDEYKYPIYSNTLGNKGIYGYSNNFQYESDCLTITARGDIGKAEYRAEPFNAIVRLLVLKPKKDVSCYFTTNYINTMFDFQHVGSAVNQLTCPMIADRLIAFPPLHEQKKIAGVLGALDDKIELNRKMNKTLESLGQAIFRRWFVDFEKMPEGWEIITAEKELKIAYGKNLPTNDLIDRGYPVYGGNGVIGFHSKYLYSKPQMIVACRGAACGALHKTKPNSFVTNNSLIFEIPEYSSINIYFLEYYLKSIDRTEFVTGSAQPQITVSNLNHIKILRPDKKILDKFQEIMKPISDKIYLNEQEIETLSQIRDSLLPWLMSGKLRVK